MFATIACFGLTIITLLNYNYRENPSNLGMVRSLLVWAVAAAATMSSVDSASSSGELSTIPSDIRTASLAASSKSTTSH